MHHTIVTMFVLISLTFIGCSEEDSRARKRAMTSASALDKMVVAFQGSHSKGYIQSKLDQAFRLYDVPTTEENYHRYGSVLVALRKGSNGVTEMEILDYTIRSHVSGISIRLGGMMAISAAALESGDR